MVRGGQIDDRCVGCRQRIRTQAAFVQRQRANRRTVCVKNLVQLAVAGVFQPIYAIASQKPNDQMHQVFRACADQNVVGRDVDAAKIVQISRDLFAQFDRAARVGRVQQAVGIFAEHAAAEPRPRGERKAAVVHNIGAEVVKIVLFLRGRQRHGGAGRLRLRGHGKLLLHEIAAPRRGGKIPFGQQLAVGGFDRDLTDMQIGGKLATQRSTVVGRRPASAPDMISARTARYSCSYSGVLLCGSR